MKPPFIRNPYNYDTKQASEEAAYKEQYPSLTVQSQALDTDINEIIRRVGLGAPMPVNPRLPEYGDYSEITDFRSALLAVEAAQKNFMTLPANVRATFQNDPQAFLQYVTDPRNLPGMIEMGLASRIDPKPIAAPGAPQAAATEPKPDLSTGRPPGNETK